MLIIFVRILFGIATFIVMAIVSVVLARVLCNFDQKKNESRLKSAAWFFSTLIGSVFATLWCVLKGIV